MQHVIGQISDVADHARQTQAALWYHAVFDVMTLMEIWIGTNGLTRDFVEGDVLRRQARRGRNHQRMPHTLGKVDAPLHNLHRAQTATHGGRPLRDAQRIGEPRLAGYPVAHRNDGKIRTVTFVGMRLDRQRPARAAAAAEIVRAHHEEAIGIDRLAGTDAVVPPAGFRVLFLMVAGRVGVTRQGVANQYRVVACRVQLAIGLITKVVRRQGDATIERQRLIKMPDLRKHQADTVGVFGFGHEGATQARMFNDQGAESNKCGAVPQ